jgi:hypothetical protein
LEAQTSQVADFLKENFTPLGFREEERLTTGDPVVDIPFLVAEWFGLNKRLGVPTDPFTTVEKLNELKSDAAITEFLRDMDLSRADEQALINLAILHPELMSSRVMSELRKRALPGVARFKKFRSKGEVGKAYRGLEVETAKELQKLLKQ